MDPARLCPCHGVPMYRRPKDGRHWCNERRKAVQARYEATGKGAATWRRYRVTDQGVALRRMRDARRLWIAGRLVGWADAPGQAQAINAHVKRRLREFTETQRGT